MASESTVSVTLPAELDDWLDERAAALDADRETVLVQLLASYRATAELDGEYDPSNGQGMPGVDSETVENAVQSILAETLDDRVESAVQTQVRAAVQSTVEGRLEDIQGDYMEKIEDVRERVIQLKRELDAKAAADHDHAELDRVAEVTARLDDIESSLDEARDDLDGRLADQEDATEDIQETLDSLQDRLKTVAWVVSDLREAHENGGVEAVDRLKRAAAQENVDHANCESCGETVSIGLLTEPNCPHCQTTVTDVKPSSGFFGKPRLLTASQLEAGEDDE
jgi:DNA repair exonuclease SbcCD ATPase subunit